MRIQRFLRDTISTIICKKLGLLIFWLILILSIVNVYISIAAEKISRYHFYNSDAISIPAMYKDLVSGYSLRGWFFGPAPSLFPDLPLYAIIRFLTGNLHLAIMGYGVVQILLLILSFGYLSDKVFEPRRSLQTLIVLAGIVLCLCLSTGQCNIFLPILLNSFHFGAVLLLVFSLILVVQIIQCGSDTKKALLYSGILLVVSPLILVSDAIYLVQFLIPVLLSLLLLFLFSMISAKSLLLIYIALIPSVLVNPYLNRYLIIYLNVSRSPGHYKTLAETLAKISKAVQDIFRWPENLWIAYKWFTIFRIVWIAFLLISIGLLALSIRKAWPLRDQTLKNPGIILTGFFFIGSILTIIISFVTRGHRWAVWIGFILVSILLAVLSIKESNEKTDRRTQEALFLLVISFFVLSVLVNIAAILFIGGGEPRYFLSTMLIPLFWGWPFLVARSKRIMILIESKYGRYILVILTCGLYVSSGAFTDLKNIPSLLNLVDYYPDFVRCLDEQTAVRNIRNGMTQYWYAKYSSLLSKHQLHLVQVRQLPQGLFMEHFVNNLNWYNNDFEFIITEEVPWNMRSIWESLVIEKYGEPADTFSCEDEKGVERKILVYNRPEDKAFQQIFRKYFSLTFYAAELPSETGRVMGLSRVADEESSPEGFLTYGPYVTLRNGDYTFEMHYYVQKSHDKSVGEWDIITHTTDAVETESTLKGRLEKEGQNIVSGVFKVRKIGKTEIRSYYKGNGLLRVDKILINRIR